MQWLIKALKGVVIGLANVIPGVSGGTMMVSMGIYDTLIYAITHIFKEFKKCFLALLPYIVGMAAGIFGLAFLIKLLLSQYSLPTQACFIGLILGGLPILLREVKGEKIGAVGAVLFVLFFALIIGLQLLSNQRGADVVITLNVVEIIKLVLAGTLASATMVIPGVSGSMVMMLIGYYNPVISALNELRVAAFALDFAAMGAPLLTLLPFAAGIVLGIFFVAKLIEMLIKRYKGYTYCAILGLVAASPVALLMGASYAGVTVWTVVVSVLTFAAGFALAYYLSKKDTKPSLAKSCE